MKRQGRTLRFTVVGLGGFVVQLGALAWLTARARWPYQLAAVAAVEAALLHNFWWHERWTWGDRTGLGGWPQRLARFHLSTGVTSIGGSVLFTVIFVEIAGVHEVAANAIAVVLTAVFNYISADRWVFAPEPRVRQRTVQG